jgi:hypothetical protein
MRPNVGILAYSDVSTGHHATLIVIDVEIDDVDAIHLPAPCSS